MVVATQEVFSHTDGLVEVWGFTDPTPERTLVVKDGRFGVVLTNTTGVPGTDEIELGPYTVSRPKPAGVGNDAATAVGARAAGVATDGTWEFEGITGVTASTAQGVAIYATANAAELTTTAAGNTKVGVVNYPATYTKAAGKAPVKILGSN